MPHKDPDARAEYSRQYYLQNKERFTETHKKRYERNSEAIKARTREWYQENKEEFLAKRKEYYQKNKEYISKRNAEYKRRNRERRNERERARYARSPEVRKKISEYKQEYTQINKERIAKVNHEYYLKHKADYRARFREYYAIKISNGGHHTAQDVAKLWEKQQYQCAVPNCPYPIAASGPEVYHVDHVYPLIEGGSNWPFNLQLLCRRHNCSKDDKDPNEWGNPFGLVYPSYVAMFYLIDGPHLL